MPKRSLPTWDQLGAAPPESVLETRARIVHLQNEIAAITEQVADPLPREQRDREYSAWLAGANAALRQKQYLLRRLRIWEQDYNSRLSTARSIQRREKELAGVIEAAKPEDPAEAAHKARQEELRRQVNERLGDDLIMMGVALKHASKAWGIMIRIAVAADEYIAAEQDGSEGDDSVADAAFARLVAAVQEARTKKLLAKAH